MIMCPFCHFNNEDGALFCEQCKSDLSGVPEVPEVRPVPVEPLPVVAEPIEAVPVLAEAVPIEAVPLVAKAVKVVPVVAEPVAVEPVAVEPVAVPVWEPPPQPKAPEPPPCPLPPPGKLEPAVLRRHSDVSFPLRAQVGRPTLLRVKISPEKRHQYDAALDLELPWGADSVRVTVYVTAENFTVEGDPQAEILVPREGDSHPALFRLVGQAAGPGRVMVDFTQEGRVIGSIDLFPEVVPGEQGPAEAGERTVSLLAGAGAGPDVTLLVHESRYCPGRLHFILSSRHPGLKGLACVNHGDLGTVDLHEGVAAWVQRQLEALHAFAAAGHGDRMLADVGNRLYEQVLPEALQRLCWEFADRGVRTLLVLSDEPHIPWELVKPFRAEPATGRLDGWGFWGESFALGRWIRGPALPERLAARHVCALGAVGQSAWDHRDLGAAAVPPGSPTAGRPSLPSAVRELELLCSLGRCGITVRVLPARRRELLDALGSGEFDVIHVASHGSFGGVEAADASALLLEDGLLRACDLPPRLAGAFRRAAPFVFFNGCHTGRLGYSLTRLGAWGAELARLGCAGFVGTLWAVRDEVALEMAGELYRLLFGGEPVAEALRQARLAVRQRHPGDPSWLAYCCFADPTAQRRGDAPPAAADATFPPGAEPKLLVMRGQKRNAEFLIYQGDNYVGRADEKPVDIDLEDQEPPDRVWCSRQHALITFDGSRMLIEDLNSANGTYLNREKVYPGPDHRKPLKVNDIIQIGNVQLKVIV
jgi:hypothetical protein